MSRIITVANQKGGVGKTTTAVNLAASLAVAERKTLIVDIDPQGNAASGLGVNGDELDQTIYEVLIAGIPAREAVVPSEIPGLDVIASGESLVGAEIELVTLESREFRLRSTLKGVQYHYEYVIIDCPPSLGLLTLNALIAADSVLIPIQCEYYALEGLSRLLGTIKRVQQHYGHDLRIEGVLLTMYDGRLKLSNDVASELESFFGDMLFQTTIPRNVRLSEAPSHGKPAVLYDVGSRGAESYLSLARELMQREQKSFRKGA